MLARPFSICILLASGCGAPFVPGSSDGSEDQVTLSDHDVATNSSAADGTTAVVRSLDFARTLGVVSQRTRLSATEVLSEIESRAGALGCASWGRSANTIVITLASKGCKLPSGAIAVGTMTATAQMTTPIMLEASLRFESASINGKTLEGMVRTAISRDGTVVLDAQLTSDGASVSVDATIRVTPATVELTGTGSGERDGQAVSFTYADLRYAYGTCYPDFGLVDVATRTVAGRVAFDALTPKTGAVTVTIGTQSKPATLSSYGSCPPVP